MFTAAFWTAAFGAFVTLVTALLDRWMKARAGNPVVLEAEKAGAAQAALEIRNQTDEQERKTASAVAAVELGISTPDGLREYEVRDPDNLDNQPGGAGKA